MISRFLVFFTLFINGFGSFAFAESKEDGRSKPLTISLAEFRKEARQQLEAYFGPLTEEGEVIFEDGFARSLSNPYRFDDLGRLYYSVPVKPVSDIDPNIRATFYISTAGTSSIGLVKYVPESDQVFYQFLGLIVQFKEGVEANSKAKILKSTYPDILATKVEFCPNCTWDSPLVEGLVIQTKDASSPQGKDEIFGALSILSTDPDLNSWEFSLERFSADVAFGKAQRLGNGLDDRERSTNRRLDTFLA